MIQVYTNDLLVYDSRLDSHRLLGLSITTGVNKSGTASIQMPPGHPTFDRFVSYRSVVTIFRDDVLVFRGRPLDATDDLYKRRTITCEGERGFFQDGVARPYLYQDTPANIFSAVLAEYNDQVENFKQFSLGTVTVTDPNDYVRIESTKAEQTADVFNKLIERCGGYITFSTNSAGNRCVNWLDELDYKNNQTIEFGQNLTNYTCSESSAELVTRVIPYGAKDETTDAYLTIESVNDGVDYVDDAEAVALRGVIAKPVYWDDVTEPANLLRKAREYLASYRTLITSIKLTAVDLSALNKKLDAFRPGDKVRVVSKPHGVDEYFVLLDKTENLLELGSGNVTLGKEKASLVGLGVASDTKNRSELQKVERDIRAEYTVNLAAAVEETKRLLSSLIEQTSEAIKLEVSETYATNGDVTEAVSTSMTQLADSFTFLFNQLQTTVDTNDAAAREHITEQLKYIRFEDGAITLGEADNAITLVLENDMISFRKNGVQFGWWDGVDFHTGNIVVELNERAQFGNFALVPRSNGSLSLLKVGG